MSHERDQLSSELPIRHMQARACPGFEPGSMEIIE